MQFFEELPFKNGTTKRANSIDWEEAKRKLMENEGQWGLMATEISNSTPHQLSSGRYKAFRGEELDHFEFAVRRPPHSDYAPRMSDLYGRYTKDIK